ncbi:hypothetical protein PVT67_03570 [Gallaecimonas kandeliae]|uniref:hypothetical protein n=1 Tax=Gallaecimonas kandeliae TaxID=3029055 RepID=UPI002648565F|nr:hypothetical protein [Gallaecimonas kandeliae]WKE66341.1 hypothetical protein PVT67_03570 [Gallaecimonas kandeliae]
MSPSLKRWLLWLILLLAAPALAEGGTDDQGDKDSDLPPWAIDKITPVVDTVSGWVNDVSRNIDSYFGSDDYLKVENHSYLRLSEELVLRQHRSDENDLGIRYKLQLPTTQERLKLIIESDPEEGLGTLEQQAAQDFRTGRFDGAKGAVIGLEGKGANDKTMGWENRLSGGIKLHLPVDPYVRFTNERLWQLGNSPWTLEVDNRLSWFNSKGYSARTLWDLGRPLNDKRFLRFVTQFQWQEDYDRLEFYQRAEYNQLLGRRSAMRYSAVLLGEGAHNPQIDDYYLEALYRRNIHHGFLYVDVAPSLHFPREVNFDPSWEIKLRLEIYFRGDIVRR